MARARRAQTPTAGQLTLDDWAEVVKASPDATSVDAAPNGHQKPSTRAVDAVEPAARHHLVATKLLETPGALLTRSHLRELGLERRAIDAVFRKLPVVTLPGYSRPMIHVEEYRELIAEHTYRDDRVRPRHA